MPTKISVVVCTYNRAKLLQKALNSLSKQTLSQNDFEVIVVDNNSTDKTKQTVKSITCIKNLRYLFEKKQGLSIARNTGWKNATSSIVAFLDDDAIASKNWLKNILLAFNKDKEIACVGGKIKPKWQTKKPAWLSKKFFGAFSLLDYGEKQFFVSKSQWLGGGNSAWQKAVLVKLGGFSLALGRKPGTLLSNDETSLQKKATKSGFKLLYNSKIVIFHFIPKERLTKKWLLERAFWQGVSSAMEDKIEKKHSSALLFARGIAGIFSIAFSPRKFGSLILPCNNKKQFEIKCQTFARIGYIQTALGVKK